MGELHSSETRAVPVHRFHKEREMEEEPSLARGKQYYVLHTNTLWNRGNNMVLTKVHIYHPNAKKKLCSQEKKRLKGIYY